MTTPSSPDSIKITACILALNEEVQLEEAIETLAGWTDQLIVIDNESTDCTAEIARRYTDVVLSAPRKTQYDALRNLAIEHATGDWVFGYSGSTRSWTSCALTVLRQCDSDAGGGGSVFTGAHAVCTRSSLA